MTAAELNRRVGDLVEQLDRGILRASRETLLLEIQALSLASIAVTLKEETKLGGAFKQARPS